MQVIPDCLAIEQLVPSFVTFPFQVQQSLAKNANGLINDELCFNSKLERFKHVHNASIDMLYLTI